MEETDSISGDQRQEQAPSPWLDRAFDKDVLNLGQACCRLLPRELRDHVYSYLWDDETINKYTYYTAEMYYYETSTEKRKFPQFVLGKAVSHQFAFEAMEWLFSQAATLHVGDPRWMDDFLNWDAYGLGLRPIDYRLRGLTLTVASDEVCPRPPNEVYGDLTELSSLPRMNFRDDFAIHIKIKSGPEAMAPWSLQNSISALQGFVRHIKCAFLKVTADYSVARFKFPEPLEEMDIVSNMDITDMFSMTRIEQTHFLKQKRDQATGLERSHWVAELRTPILRSN